MTDSPVADAHRLLVEAADVLSAAAESGAATDAELLSVLAVCERLTRRLDRLTLTTIGPYSGAARLPSAARSPPPPR